MVKKVEIGAAVLYLGDCMEIMPGLPRPAAIVTDPPYGIGYKHSGRSSPRRIINNEGRVTGNERANSGYSKSEAILGDDRPFDPTPIIEASPRVLIWGAEHFRARLPEGGRLLCWDKAVGVGPADSFVDAEFAWTNCEARRNVYRHLWKGLVATGMDAPGSGRKRFHVSQKPRELMRWCIELVRPSLGGVVCDPYMGSGSTGVAAVSMGYRFVGIELDLGHFTVACRRIAEAQGIPWPPAIADVRDAYELTEQQAARLEGGA